MWTDIFNKFHSISWHGYLQQILALPLEVFFRFLPASGLTFYYLLNQKFEKVKFNITSRQTLWGLTLINFIPYWLAPDTSIRYFLPLYPFIALLLAIKLWHLSERWLKITIAWLALAILLKYVAIGFVYYYQVYYRGDYTQIAKQIIMQTKGFPIYANNSVATGLSVTAEIDRLIYPNPPLTGVFLC